MIYILGCPVEQQIPESRFLLRDTMIGPIKTYTVVALTTDFFLLLMFGSGCSFTRDSDVEVVQSLPPAPFGQAVFLGHLENQNITEASGIAASRLHPGILWVANDGGDAPALYAVDMQGAHIGRVNIRNAQNVDWEDLAAFRVNNTAFLLIGDFGDNHARRKQNVLYLVREPDISDHPGPFDFSVDWHRRIRFVYEDGPRDCEGVAVDPDRNQILLLTKRTAPPVLYTLPLRAEKEEPLMIARRLAVVDSMLPPAAASVAEDVRFDKIRSQPTSMDVSPNGSEIAILTYGDGYLYRRPAHLGWTAAFRKPPELIGMPALRQAEALCFTANGQSLIITSEQLPAPLYRLDRTLPLHGSRHRDT